MSSSSESWTATSARKLAAVTSADEAEAEAARAVGVATCGACMTTSVPVEEADMADEAADGMVRTIGVRSSSVDVPMDRSSCDDPVGWVSWRLSSTVVQSSHMCAMMISANCLAEVVGEMWTMCCASVGLL